MKTHRIDTSLIIYHALKQSQYLFYNISRAYIFWASMPLWCQCDRSLRLFRTNLILHSKLKIPRQPRQWKLKTTEELWSKTGHESLPGWYPIVVYRSCLLTTLAVRCHAVFCQTFIRNLEKLRSRTKVSELCNGYYGTEQLRFSDVFI